MGEAKDLGGGQLWENVYQLIVRSRVNVCLPPVAGI